MVNSMAKQMTYLLSNDKVDGIANGAVKEFQTAWLQTKTIKCLMANTQYYNQLNIYIYF